jgi:glycosyltransferase involved in cell wall biosynthesis
MNILLITNLYPFCENQSRTEQTYALHNFSIEWKKNNNITVIRCLKPFYRNLFSGKSLYPKIGHVFEIDGIRVFNVKMIKIPMTKKYISAFLIKRLLKKINFYPNLILAHYKSSFIAAEELSIFYKCNFVMGIHDGDLLTIKDKKYAKALSHCSNIACRSLSLKKEALEHFPEYENKIFIASSGIDLSDIEDHNFFENKIQKWKKKDKLSFITVSSFKKKKNVDTIINALSSFSDYNFEYIIIGDGKEKENLKKEAEKNKLSHKISFLGQKTREEILSILKDTDVFILVSAPETFGLVYLEAMAKGNIVIGSKNQGIDGIIIDGKNGFLAEAGNADDLVSVIKRIFSLPFEEKKRLLYETEQTILKNTNAMAAEHYLKSISFKGV